MTHTIIAGIQILPKGNEEKKAEALKKALTVIEQSGLHFHKDHFEIIVEGNFEQVVRVIEAVQLSSFNAGIDELLLNVRFHSQNGKDLKLNK